MESLLIKCPGCNMEIGLDKDADITICQYCGYNVLTKKSKSKVKVCIHCGETNHNDSGICIECGHLVEGSQNLLYSVLQETIKALRKPLFVINNNTIDPKEIKNNPDLLNKNQGLIPDVKIKDIKKCSKWIALFFCIFLGFFGAHKFYEGKTRYGIIYVCTLGLFGIGWVTDIILILLRPNPYYVI